LRSLPGAACCVQACIIAAERGIQLDGEEAIDPDRLLPGGVKSLVLRDWTLSPGVRFRASSSSSSSSSEARGSSSSSSDGNLKYYVTLRKQPQVGAVLGAAFYSSKRTRREHFTSRIVPVLMHMDDLHKSFASDADGC
jgi:hypothetical protein